MTEERLETATQLLVEFKEAFNVYVESGFDDMLQVLEEKVDSFLAE